MDDFRRITALNAKRNAKPAMRLTILQKLLLLLAIIIGLMTTLPVLLVLFIGLLPTLTLMVIDAKNINKIIVVGGFNLAGVFVYVFNVLHNFSIDNALFIFSDIFNMILMLGSAGVGLIVYYEMPLLFVFLARSSNQKRIVNIENKIEKLKETWGQNILS